MMEIALATTFMVEQFYSTLVSRVRKMFGRIASPGC